MPLTAKYSKKAIHHSPPASGNVIEASASTLLRYNTASIESKQHIELIHDESMDSSDELNGPPDDLTYHIRKLRIGYVNWRMDWGEPNWETEFGDQLLVARKEDRIHEFLEAIKRHVREGRDLLYDLKFLGEVSCNNTHDEIRDLFLQGYDMAIAIASQVKFFEIKQYQIEHLQDPVQ
jgi:hypothetical protein